MASTEAAIIDRITALVSDLNPLSDVGVPFRSSLNEGSANFIDQCEAQPAGCLRRFQARTEGSEEPPEVSNTLVDLRHFTVVVLVAYPTTGRWGTKGAVARDRIIHEDFKRIEQAIGIYGRANFSGAYDCTPLGNEGSPMKEIERGVACDFLQVTARFSYYATVGS